MTRSSFIRRLYAGPANARLVANPFRDEHADLDRTGAARQRRRNLEAYLEAVGEPRVVLVGEAMGYRGARFSGIAFTSERQLAGPRPLSWAATTRVGATSLRPELWTEPSGTIVWHALAGRAEGVLLWNAFPWHPYRAGGTRDVRLTNRTPTGGEVRAAQPVLGALLEWAAPREVLAVGRVAAAALAGLGIEARTLRHPARGGANLFRSQLGGALAGRGI
jgi:uracil-DNA glycosylase